MHNKLSHTEHEHMANEWVSAVQKMSRTSLADVRKPTKHNVIKTI